MCRVKETNAPTLEDLQPESRSRVEALLTKGWELPGKHTLARLHGQGLGGYRLFVLVGPKNNVGSRYFQLFLLDGKGRLSDEFLALGLQSSGPFPAFNWVEFTQYRPALRIGGKSVGLAAEGLDLGLFEAVSELVPPGGHIMCEYDSPGQQATARVLTLGYPPAASPIGYLMFRAGCRSYRDWYISEGGREGPRKLQGFKSLDAEIGAEKTAALRAELEELLSRPDGGAQGEPGGLARRLAADVLERLSA